MADERRRTSDDGDTDTQSLREERGESGAPADPREALAEVPLAPHSAGALGVAAAPSSDDSSMPETAEADVRAARKRAKK